MWLHYNREKNILSPFTSNERKFQLFLEVVVPLGAKGHIKEQKGKFLVLCAQLVLFYAIFSL